MFLEAAPRTKPCNHPLLPNAQCPEARELHYDGRGIRQSQPGAWHVLARAIEGYAHEPGVRQAVQGHKPPADAASTAMVLGGHDGRDGTATTRILSLRLCHWSS